MAITESNIKLMQAQVNNDTDEGGGSMTGNEIVDGQVNSLFPNISRVDSVGGDVAMRKFFLNVDTNTQDTYYGAHAIIQDTPDDAKVSAVLFSTDDPHDKRLAAQNLVEAYLTESYEASFYLFGKHIKGQKTLRLLQRKEQPLPEIGDVYCIREGSKKQFVRVSELEHTLNYFTYTLTTEPVDYERREISLVIEQPLDHDFNGSIFIPQGRESSKAEFLYTQVANASKYYGTKTLADAATVGDTAIKVDSIFESIVPAAKRQIPLTNQIALGYANVFLPAQKSIEEQDDYYVQNYEGNKGSANQNWTFELNDSLKPGSLVFYLRDTGNYKKLKCTDNGDGAVTAEALVGEYPEGFNCDIDYAAGRLHFNGTITSGMEAGRFGYLYDLAYTPAIALTTQAIFSDTLPVTLANAGTVFTMTLYPAPTAASTYVDYQVLGKWYRIYDTGDGTLKGENDNLGGGQLTYNQDGSAVLVLTLGSVPDIDSEIMISWGSDIDYEDHNAEIATLEAQGFKAVLKLPHLNLVPDSVRIWTSIQGYNTWNNDDANGDLVIPNHANCKIHYGSGEVHIDWIKTAFFGIHSTNSFTVEYKTYDQTIGNQIQKQELTPALDNGNLNIDTGYAIEAGRLKIEFWVKRDTNVLKRTLIAQSNGDLVELESGNLYSAGAVNFATGIINFTPTKTFSKTSWQSGAIGNVTGIPSNQWATTTEEFVTEEFITGIGREVKIEFIVDGAGGAESAALQYKFDLANPFFFKFKLPENIIGEVAFQVEDNSILRSENGVIHRHYLPENTKTTNVGSIDYKTGEIELNAFEQSYNGTIGLKVLQLKTDKFAYSEPRTIEKAAFRTATQSLQHGSLTLRATSPATGFSMATADNSGAITGDNISTGFVKAANGIVKVEFINGVEPDSIKYDAVAESILPLDPKLLGINSIRLPADGKVPVINDGSFLVIYHEQETDAGTPTAGQTINVGRTDLAFARVEDANGVELKSTEYTVDEAAGNVTFANPLNLVDESNNPLTTPLKIIDRIEDFLMATSVKFSGDIELSANLAHSYPANETKVASALVWGDIGAKVTVFFSQEVWNNGDPNWVDEREGDNTTAQYDTINYPVSIVNQGSTTGRWAIIFTSATTVKVAEEKLGVVADGIDITTTNVAPINPATNTPYFTLSKDGFGSGWVTNNVIRFNTEGGNASAWLIRAVQAGALTTETDSLSVEFRGDIA